MVPDERVDISDIKDMESLLKQQIGESGLNYLQPQLDVIRNCRNLPKDVDDEKLITAKFYLALNVIRQWLSPVSEFINVVTEKDVNDISLLQQQAKALIQENKIISWKQAKANLQIANILNDIEIKKGKIRHLHELVLNESRRDDISTLLGLLMFPFVPSADYSFKDAKEKARSYFGKNYTFSKNNIYTDALITMLVAQKLFEKQKGVATSKQNFARQLNATMGETWILDKEREEWDKYTVNATQDGYFTERQVEMLVKKFMGVPRITGQIRSDIFPHYLPETDRYRIDGILEWLQAKQGVQSEVPSTTIVAEESVKKYRQDTKFLLGMAFLDRHVDNYIAGNIPESSVKLFEKMLGPFNELKQYDMFMKSAQFSIQAFGLPEQAWIYDYTGIKSEVLRSTLLLISDRQPKFDTLEACQRFYSAVLGGRIVRNDVKEGTFTYTDLLPKSTWNYIVDVLMKILEETLVFEESRAIRIIKSIFAEEDRTVLVTSKKYVPAFYLELKHPTGKKDFNQISIYKREGFNLQFRHVQAAGYPWYFDSNKNLEFLVSDALAVKGQNLERLTGNVNLKQCVLKVDEQAMIIIYDPNDQGLTALAFKEVDITEQNTIPAVEILFRPRQFLDQGPIKNNLKLVLENARASDPKDLQAIVSNL